MNTSVVSENQAFPILFETMEEWVWIWDHLDRTISVNRRFLELSGYSEDEVSMMKSSAFWDEDTQARIHAEHEKKRKKWLTSVYPAKLRRKDGSIVHVNILWSPLPDGGTIGIITDMSLYIEKKESEDLLLDAIRHSLQGIIVVKKKKIVSWNRGAKFILWYKESEVIDKWLVGIFMNEDIKKIYSIHEEDSEVEVLWKRKDGERITLILTVIWSQHDPETCILLMRDISHIRKSEAIITQKHDYLMQTVKEYWVIKRKMEYIQELQKLFHNRHTDLQKIYDFFVYSTAHIASIEWSGLRIMDQETWELHLVAHYGIGWLKTGKHIQKYTGSITEESYHKRKPVRIIDLINDPRLSSLTMAHTQRFQTATLYALQYHGKCIWSIMFFMEDMHDPFDDEFLMHYIELFGLLLGGRG